MLVMLRSAVSFPFPEEPDKTPSGGNERQREAGIEHGDETFRQQMCLADGDAHPNHERHDNPPLHIKEREGTMSFPLSRSDTLRMLAVELVENHAEEQQEHQTGFTDLQEPVVRVRNPAGDANLQNIEARHQPHHASRQQQGIGRNSVLHLSLEPFDFSENDECGCR